MNKLTLGLAGLVLGCLSTSCATYTGVAKADGQIYISGMTNYFIFSTPWIRRCDVDGTQLTCEELTEDKPRKGAEGKDGKADDGAGKTDAKPEAATDAKPAEAKPAK